MRKKLCILVVMALIIVSCKTHYQVASIERSRIVVDARYDTHQDAEAVAFLAPYQHVVDSIMGPVVGYSAKFMQSHRPESELSNLLADIMVWAAKDYNEQVDFGVYNMGGIRASLPEGKVTYGDILDIAPFENKICFLTLSGEKVIELFQQIAARAGEGLSHGVQLTITPDSQLVSVTINGSPIDKNRSYRIATLDYLSQGNDGMDAFKSHTNLVSPQSEDNNIRYIIIDYFRDKMAKGQDVDTQLEGRVAVKN